MNRTRLLSTLPALLAFVACSAPDNAPGPGGDSTGFDSNGDLVADDLGTVLDKNGDNIIDLIDINKDGKMDGMGVDTDGDGELDALLLDTDCDGYFDAIDTDGDMLANWFTGRKPPSTPPGCSSAGTGGSVNPGAGGSVNPGTGGSVNPGTGGSVNPGTGGSVNPGTGGMGTGGERPLSELGNAQYQGSGKTTDRYAEGDIYRNGVGYKFIANGWGEGWQSHEISWNGTSFTVINLNGSQGGDFSPAGYPTMFCGAYSTDSNGGAFKTSVGQCGLPAAINSLQSVRTGWRWKPNGNGQYNAAWDIWLSNSGSDLSAYLMVWLRDPPGQQPAGSGTAANATVEGLPGTWTIWTGNVNGRPIVNYIKPEGQDLTELEFDVLDVYNDAKARGYNLPGSQILSVAIGYEIWNGPVSNIVTEDFYVTVN